MRGTLAIGFVAAVLASACAAKPRPVAPSPAAAPAASAPDGAADEGEEGIEEGGSPPEASETAEGERAEPAGPCPADMALIKIATPLPTTRRFCIDKYEASLVEVLADGTERAYPHFVTVDGHDVRAVSKPHSFPQGFISEVQASDACAASGKRLCNHDEWKTACMGPARTTFPYGDARRPGACHDTGKSAVGAVFGAKALAASTPASPPAKAAPGKAAPTAAGAKRAHVTKGRAAHATRPRASAAKAPRVGGSKSAPKAAAAAKPSSSSKVTRRTGRPSTRPSSVEANVWTRLNEPALGQVEGALARTGEHGECVNAFGVFDMVGNIHEWVATDPNAVHGTFAGGYYLDTALNGDGCNYRTVAHAHDYHDYSTGFRCCSSAASD